MKCIYVALALATTVTVWGQGGRNQGRGAPGGRAAQAGAAEATPGGRGGRAGADGTLGASGTLDFYNFDSTASSAPPIPDAAPAETHQKITAGGQSLAYTTHAGFLPLRNATTGQSEAHLFYTSYAKDGVSDASTRPLIFFVGGAHGVATAWQEFGGFGPKRMKAAAESGEAAPGAWAENPNTLLGQADLVFVDPVGTGFSRPDRPERASSFWNSAADIASLGEFVRTYINRNDRRTSPLFLAGEDWGTGRVAGLAGYLDEHQVPVRGVVLLSVTENTDALAGDTQYITLLPSLVMAAWHHKKLAPELNNMSSEQIAGQARQFASREYLHALYKGDRMTPEERTKVVADLARMTGLSKAFIVSNDLRLTLDRFNSELMRDQHRGLSPSDARVTGFVPLPAGGGRGGGGGGFGFGAPPIPIDFNLSERAGPFLTSYESYLRRELTFNGNPDAIFYLMTGGVSPFTSSGNDDASLAAAFARNPNLHLFVSVNYFDLNAPFYATEFTLAHLNVSPEVRAHNITLSHLEAGQMPYLDLKAGVKLQAELAGFINQAISPAHK